MHCLPRWLAPLSLVIGSQLLLWTSPASCQPYYGGWGGGYHSSTAAEGAMRGMGDAVRSQGMKNVADSQAAINLTEAQDRAIDNDLKATNAYWDKKKIYEQNTAEKRYKEAQVRQEHRSRRMLKQITPQELDPTSGQLSWPMICREEQYTEYRDPLAKLFQKRGMYGVLESDDYLQAKQLIKDFRAAITANKAAYPSEARSQSLRFLLKLNRELDANF